LIKDENADMIDDLDSEDNHQHVDLDEEGMHMHAHVLTPGQLLTLSARPPTKQARPTPSTFPLLVCRS
jgi:hypothetical protein